LVRIYATLTSSDLKLSSFLDNLRHEFNQTLYRGNAHKAFYSYLTAMDSKFVSGGDAADRTKLFYGKFCSVAQSSGTGKTRLLVELPDTRVLYMNLRGSEDSLNYPPRDLIPADMLNAHGCSQTQFEQRCCAFFAAIFNIVQDELTRGVGKEPQAWRDAFHPSNTTQRTNFFNSTGAQFNRLVSWNPVNRFIADHKKK
jgi:hypothetical protein